jgi:lysozyme family protein
VASKNDDIHEINAISDEDKAKSLDQPENGDDMHADPDAPVESVGGLEAAVRQWRVAKALETLRIQINTLCPGRDRASDGGIGDAAHATRASDHNPWVIDAGIGVVTARDYTHDPAHGCDGNRLADLLRASRDPRIKYIIWNRRICASQPMGGQPAWAWRPYTGDNPHNKHLHLSVFPDKALYDSTTEWAIAALPGGVIPAVVTPAPAAPAPTPASAVTPLPKTGTPEHDAAIAELDRAAQALLGLTPLLQRLTDLQDSDDAAINVRAGELLGRYRELTRIDSAPQPTPAPDTAPVAAAVQPSPPAPLPPFTGTGFADLKLRYEMLYAGAVVRPEWASTVAWHRQKLLQYRPRYDPVAAKTGVPWWFIGIVHALEGSFNFTTHLHNGDPLTAKTVRVPAGRPLVWNPPNDWETSAADALQHDGLAGQGDWTLARVLYRFERYNGMSYYSHGINSPYLWSFSNQYSKGKFVADHQYDPNAVSKQCGAAVMLRALANAGDVSI